MWKETKKPCLIISESVNDKIEWTVKRRFVDIVTCIHYIIDFKLSTFHNIAFKKKKKSIALFPNC